MTIRTKSRSVRPLVAIAGLWLTTPAAAQIAEGVTERVTSHTDPSKSYATFVPAGYRVGTPAPLVIILDPRGRALVPLERLVPAAERLGYLLISSYDSRSDEDPGPTEEAVAAIIEDAQDHFTIDTRRLYFAGFSGTARLSWTLGQRFAPYTAGVIGMGAALPFAGLPAVLAAEGPWPFPFYGGAGEADFNWDEVQRLDRTLDEYGAPHFVEEWEGPHAWPDSTVFGHALEWLDTRAVVTGLQERPSDELRRRYDREVARAQNLLAGGRPERAAYVLGSLVADYGPLLDVTAAAGELEVVRASDAFAQATEAQDRVLAERRAFDRVLSTWLDEVRRRERPDGIRAGIAALGLATLRETAATASDRRERLAARRRLEQVYVLAVFYRPEEYLERGDFDLALAFLDVAASVHPESPLPAFTAARVHAVAGHVDEAFTALERAAAAGGLTRTAVEEHPQLASLRTDARYPALLERLPG
jgi:predicted esterase